jgi:predicted ArsR family transcriptional regulator
MKEMPRRLRVADSLVQRHLVDLEAEELRQQQIADRHDEHQRHNAARPRAIRQDERPNRRAFRESYLFPKRSSVSTFASSSRPSRLGVGSR